jgi:nucleotide-binding universal stress UspA family protein
MFKRILVPLDGSARSEQAISLAARIAHASHGSIYLLRVIDLFNEVGMHPHIPPVFAQEILEEARIQATRYLVKIARSDLLHNIDTRVVVSVGQPASRILHLAEEEHNDLIIINSHGYTGLKRWALGSVARKVLRQSPLPVLVLHEKSVALSGLSWEVAHPVRALVGLDGSSFAETALEPAIKLVAALSAPGEGELHLVQMVQEPSAEDVIAFERAHIDIDLRQLAIARAGEYLKLVKERLVSQQLVSESHIRITWSVEACQDVATALIQAAECGEGMGTHKASDLIVLATHGHGGIQRWLIGSITEKVLDGIHLPLLIVRPPEVSS